MSDDLLCHDDGTMKDTVIRRGIHRTLLRKHHACADTLVVDELGMKHGRRRADIVVINGHLNGFEIKSDKDSLRRFEEQVRVYNAVFDHATLVTTQRHMAKAQMMVPEWWGIITCSMGARGAVEFRSVRRARRNPSVDLISVAQLLWRDEAQTVLRGRGAPERLLRERRSVLYDHLVGTLTAVELRRTVRERLKNRRNWRHPAPLSPSGGSCLQNATS